VAFVYCGSAQTGEFFGVLRSPEDGSLQLSYSNPATQGLRQYYSLNVRGERTYWQRQAPKPFDSRQRPWFQAAIRAEQPTWTEVYIAFTTGLPNITASLPVYAESEQRLLGACATDVVLPEEFRTFLRQLQIGRQGQAFVVDRQGNLIANSTDEPLMVGAGDAARSLRALESRDALVQSTARYLIETFGGFKSILRPQRLEFKLDGQRQFLEVLPFSDGFGLDWLIVVVVPEADFMGQIHRNTQTTLWLSLMAVGGAIAISILTARWLTRPMLEVCHASEAIAQGNLDQQVDPNPIREMKQLTGSFNTMARQLRESFSALRIAEETYRSIFENALEGIFQSSLEGRFISVNPAMARIYGYDSPADMVASISDITTQVYVDPDGRDRFRQTLDEYGQVKNLEYRVYRKDGSIIWIEEDTRAVRDSQGVILYFEGIVQEITDRKQRETELKRQLVELQIEIDQTKREREVTQITGSGYFQELQEEINQIDLDEFWQ
jgi:PAS domain S-box-containing protein